jgi:hypothetical protein
MRHPAIMPVCSVRTLWGQGEITKVHRIGEAVPAGLEPATSHLAGERSFQLSYGTVLRR